MKLKTANLKKLTRSDWLQLQHGGVVVKKEGTIICTLAFKKGNKQK